MRKYVSYVQTTNSVVIMFNDGESQVRNDNPLYADVVKAIQDRRFDDLERLTDMASKIKSYTDGKFFVKDGLVYVGADGVRNNEPLPAVLSKRLLSFIENGLDYNPLIKFWEKLCLNPSKESVKDLYSFLEHNGVPLTTEGNFLCYKKVTNDFHDCRTQTMDYNVGRTVRMPREQVDPDRNNTCSAGLHVATYEYAHGFSSGVMVEVEVSPEHVVAVPPDYNEQKMRVCELKVVRVCEAERHELLVDSPQGSVYDAFEDDDFDEPSFS